MVDEKLLDDGLDKPVITMRAHQLLSTVCVAGGANCPLLEPARARDILSKLKSDPTLTIRLTSTAEQIPHYSQLSEEDYRHQDPAEVLNRKRDLDVLRRLGLVPGSVRRARYLFELLFERIETLEGICSHDTPGWEGCRLARSGVYERVRAEGWRAIVYHRSDEEMAAFRERNLEQIRTADRLAIRPHHLMCLCCGLAGGKNERPRPNDTLYELALRIRQDPDIPITLVEGCCMACDCCDGYHPETGRCVHPGGLVRDYKKDLDVLEKLGLMPGDTMKARELFALLFERIPSTREICAYSDGVATCNEWAICGDPDGHGGYEATRKKGIF